MRLENPISIFNPRVNRWNLEKLCRDFNPNLFGFSELLDIEQATITEQDPSNRRRGLIFLPNPQCNSTYSKNVECKRGVSKEDTSLNPPYFFGKCSYCGEDKEVTWFKDRLICEECLEDERKAHSGDLDAKADRVS